MRMVSLPRLEKCVQLRLAAGQQPSEEMQVLAGLNRISCVFIYPDSGDIVLAGPAGDWTEGPEGAIVNADNGRPVLRLDDLVVIFRQMMSGPNAKFGCRITPREENLAKLQSYLRQSQGILPSQSSAGRGSTACGGRSASRTSRSTGSIRARVPHRSSSRPIIA